VTFGQKQPGSGRAGTPIQLASGQQMDNVKLAIPKGGVLTGTVLDEQSEPSFGTQVRALRYVFRGGDRVLQPAGSATTDDRGVYRIPGLVPGDYIVNVTLPPDVNGDVALRMRAEQLAGAAQGSATVEQDMAMADLKMAIARAGLSADTTDPASAYAPVYYPGTTIAANASPVTLGPGEERSGVDVSLQLVPVSRVNGTVTGADGQPAANVSVQLVDVNQPPGLGTRSARSGPDGKFSFGAVAPGQYSVTARGVSALTMKFNADASGGKEAALTAALAAMSAAQATPTWASTDAAVDGHNPISLQLQLRPGMTVAGRIAIDSAGPPVDFTRLRVTMVPITPGVDQGSQTGVADANGNFTVAGLSPGRYRIGISGAPASLRLRTVIVAGRDALDSPLEIKPGEDAAGAIATLSDKTTTVAGAIEDAVGQRLTDYTVIAFAADSRFWTPQSRRILTARPATDGSFTFRDLPPGDYLLAAVTDVETGQWFDPAFLRPLTGTAATMKLTEGTRTAQTLRVK